MKITKIEMNAIRRIVSLFIMSLLLLSCSSANNDIKTGESIANNEPQNKAEESEAASQEETSDELSVLVTVPTINVRSDPDSKND